MNCKLLLVQSLCVFSIASSAYGGQLPSGIKLQYAYCYELRHFFTETETPSLPDPSVIDNLCMDRQGLTYHFLSSTHGAISFIAPKAGLTVVQLSSNSLGMKFDWHDEPSVSLVCRLHSPAQALHVYKDIYQLRRLSRQDVTVSSARKLLLDATSSRVAHRSDYSQRTRLFIEHYRGMKMVMTLKQESANGNVGNPLLVFPAAKYNISDVPLNNSVVARSNGDYVRYIILTFDNATEASNFCNTYRDQFDASLTTPIPPVILQEVL